MSEEEKKEMIELITPQKTDKDYEEEIERLNNIIKDVRGYIERLRKDDEYTAHLEFTYGDRDNIFRILDKGE